MLVRHQFERGDERFQVLEPGALCNVNGSVALHGADSEILECLGHVGDHAHEAEDAVRPVSPKIQIGETAELTFVYGPLGFRTNLSRSFPQTAAPN